MAFIEHRYCNPCAKPTQHTNHTCDLCYERERREALAAWCAKTTDEKLLDLHRRLLKREAGPTAY